jgi:hypothetical protein
MKSMKDIIDNQDKEIDFSATLSSSITHPAPTVTHNPASPAKPTKRPRGRPRIHPAPDPNAPKRPRGRQKGWKKPKTATATATATATKTKPKTKIPYIDNNNNNILSNKVIEGSNNNNIDINNQEAIEPQLCENKTDLKPRMTGKELKFIELWLSGKYTLEKAMILSGYQNYHRDSLYRLGREIVIRYEEAAQDHRKIMRAMGAGEVGVLMGLWELAQDTKNKTIRLNALSMLAKCLGLQKETLEGAAGITFVFETIAPGQGPQQGPPLPDGTPARPVTVQISQAQPATKPRRPLQITK